MIASFIVGTAVLLWSLTVHLLHENMRKCHLDLSYKTMRWQSLLMAGDENWECSTLSSTQCQMILLTNITG